MNKNIAIALSLGVVALVGIWWYMDSQQAASDKMMTQEKVMMEQETPRQESSQKDGMMERNGAGAMMQDRGQYVSYDASKLAFAKEGAVVLFFRASWCPSCRALDANIKANLSQIPADVLILDVDYDKSADLKKAYGVAYQHTLVQVDENGTMIAKWSGSPELSDLLKEIQ